jgi:hypothetical protein
MGMDGYLRKRFLNLHDAKCAKSAMEIKEPLVISFSSFRQMPKSRRIRDMDAGLRRHDGLIRASLIQK